MANQQITVDTLIAADSKKVWDYYNKPEHITKWNFASEDWQCPRAESDLRPGGKYSARMEAKDGSFGFDFNAVYDEVADGSSLSYTMEDGRKAHTRFEGLGEHTKVSTSFDAESENPADMQRAGWQAILDNFKRYVEAN